MVCSSQVSQSHSYLHRSFKDIIWIIRKVEGAKITGEKCSHGRRTRTYDWTDTYFGTVRSFSNWENNTRVMSKKVSPTEYLECSKELNEIDTEILIMHLLHYEKTLLSYNHSVRQIKLLNIRNPSTLIAKEEKWKHWVIRNIQKIQKSEEDYYWGHIKPDAKSSKWSNQHLNFK